MRSHLFLMMYCSYQKAAHDIVNLFNCPLSPTQAPWCFSLCWFSTNLSWPSLPVTTRFLSTTSSPGRYRALVVRGLSSSWVGSSSYCWRCPTAPGNGVSLRRTAAVNGPEVVLHFICPFLFVRKGDRGAWVFPKDVLAKRLPFLWSERNHEHAYGRVTGDSLTFTEYVSFQHNILFSMKYLDLFFIIVNQWVILDPWHFDSWPHNFIS